MDGAFDGSEPSVSGQWLLTICFCAGFAEEDIWKSIDLDRIGYVVAQRKSIDASYGAGTVKLTPDVLCKAPAPFDSC